MIISTTTYAIFSCFGYEKGIETAAKTGFDALDLSLCRCMDNEEFSEDNYSQTCKQLKETAEKNGIYFNQAHAPFPSIFFSEDEEKAAFRHERLVRSIKAASAVGAKQIVVHPIACPKNVDQKKFNLDFYNNLMPLCKEYKIKIALENMWGSNAAGTRCVANVCSYGRDLGAYFDELDSRYFSVCLDIGHPGLIGQTPESAIYELGSRIHALHVHDNDDVEDMHTIPFQGVIDWDSVMKALADVGYSGDFTYEVGGKYLSAYIQYPELMETALEMLVKTAKILIEKFDSYKAGSN